MAKTIIRCSQCNRRMRRVAEADGQAWNAVYRLGFVVGHLCPQCQTAEQNAEAEINAATRPSEDARLRDWSTATPEEKAKVTIQALHQHTEQVWREWLRRVIEGSVPVALDLNALTEQAWGTLPQQWKSMARTPEAVDLRKEMIRDHFEWLVEEGRPSESE